MAERVERLGGSLIVYDDSLVSHIQEQMFEPYHWPYARRVPTGGRGATLFVRHEGDEWVLKHYYRGGAVRHLFADQYLWTGADATRPFREWRLLFELQRRKLPSPVPVAARAVARGLVYTADLITRGLPGVTALSELVTNGGVSPDQWAQIGRCLRRFHDERVCHADLNAHNIQVDQSGKVWLLDFDRGRIMSGDGAWSKANLNRLNRSLRKIGDASGTRFDDAGWRALLEGYGEGSGASSIR